MVRRVVLWNAYPWYINRSPNAAELQAGAEVLKRLLGLMSKVEVVLLQGNEAQDVWRRLLKAHFDAVRDRTLEVVSTYKGSRVKRLPLTAEVGKVLADYLMKDRPRCSATAVFLTARAPYRH